MRIHPPLLRMIAPLIAVMGLVWGLEGCRSKTTPPPPPPIDPPDASSPQPSSPPPPPGSPAAYGTGAMWKVRPEEPLPGSVQETVPDAPGMELTGARNEFLSFQIVVFGGKNGAHDVTVTYDKEIKGPGAFQREDVSLYREEYVVIQKPSFLNDDGGARLMGRWPDPLIPDVDEIAHEKRKAFPFSVPPNESRAIWVDIHVPMDARAGQYQGSFKISTTSDGFGNAPLVIERNLALNLHIVDAVMPSTPSLATAFVFDVPSLCTAHNVPCKLLEDPAKTLLQGYVRMGLEHRISLSTAFPVLSTPAEWAAFDDAYGPLLDGTAKTRLPGARLNAVQYTGGRQPSGYASFSSHFKSRNWFSRAYDYTADEPPRTISFSEATSRAELAKRSSVVLPDKSDPPIRTMITSMYWQKPYDDFLPHIDVLAAMVTLLDYPTYPYSVQQPLYEDFVRQPGREAWLYQSCSSHGCAPGDIQKANTPDAGWPSVMVDATPAKNRSLEWLTFRLNMTGEFYYETALMLPTAWTDLYRYNGNGDGTLFYPGTVDRIGGITDVPIASMRLKFIRMGLQDYEWLKLTRDAGDAKCAKETADLLVPAAYLVPDNGAMFEAARERLISCYLTAKGNGGSGPPGRGLDGGI